MKVILNGSDIIYDGDKTLGYEGDNLLDVFEVEVDTDASWSYKLWIKRRGCYKCGREPDIDVFDLTRVDNICSLELTSAFLNKCGKYTMQLEATNGTNIRHSDLFNGWVLHTIYNNK